MDLLSKEAIEEVRDPGPGFYSLIFLVRKKSGSWRPVTDLSSLNKFLIIPKFRMETTRSVYESLKLNHWATSLDLKDAYLHIPVHPHHRKFLRIGYRGKVFQFKVLPFGQATAPLIFTRVVRSLAAAVHAQNLELHTYLDDWLNQAQSYQQAIQETSLLLSLTKELGWIPNWEKSELLPTQEFTFIGMHCNLRLGLVFPPQDRLEKIHQAILKILPSQGAIAHTWLHLIGLLVSAEKQVPFGRTHMRGIQWGLASQWRISREPLSKWVNLTPLAALHMKWWANTQNTLKGVTINLFQAQVSLYTDASKLAWGAYLDTNLENTVSIRWIPEEKTLHINLLELLAVQRALLHFQAQLKTKQVMVCTDNSSVVAQINKQGGTLSWSLVEVTLDIMTWAMSNQVTLRARHIPGHLNIWADQLSRPDHIMSTEWSIHPRVITEIKRIWDPPLIDLFATLLNHKLPLYVSPLPDPAAVAVDAISMSWENLVGYAYPPTPLIRKVLAKILDSRSLIYLVAPCWPNQAWFPNLLDLLIDQPRSLPPSWLPKLLMQPRTNVFHNRPHLLNLHVWPLSSDRSKRRAFLNRCPRPCPTLSESQHSRFTSPSGNTGSIGVLRGRLITSLPLSLR